MTLDDIRTAHHDDTWTTSDAQLEAFLRTVSVEVARLDYTPHTAVELRMLGRAR